MEIRVGFEPTINSFAGCPLQPLEYRIMAGIVGFKPTVAGIKGRCLSRLAISQYPDIYDEFVDQTESRIFKVVKSAIA